MPDYSLKRGFAALLIFISALLLAAPHSFAAEAAAEEAKRARAPVEIESDAMEAFSETREVLFRGDVIAREDFLLCTDELRITYDENNDVRDITATGSVRIFHESRTATAGRAVYDRDGRKLVLTGDPVVEQCKDRVSGEKITVYIDTDRAMVEGGDQRVRAVIMPEKECPDTVAAPDEGNGKTRCKRPR